MRRPCAPLSAVMSAATVADIARYQANRAPDAIALSFEGRQTTFGALDLASNQVANGLIAAGIKAQRRVAILDKNSDIFFEVLLGAAKTNAVLVPINSRLAAPEIAFILNDAEAEVLFVGESFAVTLAALRDQLTTVKLVVVLDAAYVEWRDAQSDVDPKLSSLPDDVCLQMYTSGTTGHPRRPADEHQSCPRVASAF
jgi:acyl-CoA synthetase (AMP-forming)/AMP-acid ligase II